MSNMASQGISSAQLSAMQYAAGNSSQGAFGLIENLVPASGMTGTSLSSFNSPLHGLQLSSVAADSFINPASANRYLATTLGEGLSFDATVGVSEDEKQQAAMDNNNYDNHMAGTNFNDADYGGGTGGASSNSSGNFGSGDSGSFMSDNSGGNQNFPNPFEMNAHHFREFANHEKSISSLQDVAPPDHTPTMRFHEKEGSIQKATSSPASFH